MKPTRLAHFTVALLCAIAAGGAAEVSDDWKPTLLWQDGRVVTRGAGPHESARTVIDLINGGRFDKALNAVEQVQGPQAEQRKAELALAIAGHLDVFDPEPALKSAEQHLSAALQAEPQNVALLRMQNQLAIYRAVPWLGQPTDPLLLPARDLVAKGEVEAGRKKLLEGEDRYLLNSYCLASYFARRDDLAVLLDDAEKEAQEAKNEAFLGLIRTHRKNRWAALSVQPDHLLYPRVLLGRMRAYYWWWRQMGERYRPMSKQGFFELLEEISTYFPNHDIVRMYRGERVPWGEGFRPDPVPEGAPGWAVNQRELRARVDHIVEWWFENRQAENGELGGGWEDDCETLRMWSISSICCGNSKIEAGIKRLVDGIWTSGQLVHGYDRAFKDVEHSSEMAADSSVMMLLAYGDPLYFERCLETTRTTDEVHTAVNEHGHRHFKAMKMSATEVSKEPRHGVDAMYCGRAMRPAALVAWYSGIPRAVKLVRDWAKAWSEDTLRAGKGKPAGIMPAAVRVSDDNVDGPTDKWYDPSLGDLYDWRAGRMDMVLGKMLGAWALTGDDSLLDGVREQFRILRKYQKTPVKEPTAGSLEMAGMQLVSETTRLLGMYRGYTGDPQFDDVLSVRGTGYARFLATGDPRHVESGHANELNSMRVNLPMVTSEVRGTDRVALRAMSLVGPLTGSPAQVTEPPSFAVTWRDVDPDFTALVRSSSAKSVSAWVYSFGDETTRPTMRFWRLDPGRYELRIGPDANADGKPDGGYRQQISFAYRERLDSVQFDMPPKTLCVVDLVQTRRAPTRPAQLPDLALASRDLKLLGEPVAGKPCKGEVTVHNIGSAGAADVTVEIHTASPSENAKPTLVQRLHIPALPYPADLRAKTATASFTWTPSAPAAYVLSATVTRGDEALEICSRNNRAEAEVRVEDG